MFFLVLLIIFIWMIVDYKLGRFFHIRRMKKRSYPTRKSDIALFITGQKLYDDLFYEIKNAKKHIHILFYIVKDDNISNTFLELLMDKAKQDVEVRLLLDRIGSVNLTKLMIQKLKDSGVQFSFCHVPKLPFIVYSINERNHRKIAVIDGKTGYVGGFNIGKEYLGQDPKLGDWRDYHLRIVGEGVQDLQTQFLQDWKKATKENALDNDAYFPQQLPGKHEHSIVPTHGVFLQDVFIDLIRGAKSEIIIGTPYFIPSRKLFNEILQAAKRGVNVHVIVPMRADHPFVKEAAIPYFKPLLQAGCNVYRYYYGFFHAKVIVVDGEICDIGTANFDKRSLFLNHEINCIITDRPFIDEVRESLLRDIDFSEKVTMDFLQNRSILQRLKEVFSKLISKLL
ncbi:cardiolipin synthase [Bacillus suaedaesalsae]|uniref:cardiolipin synthase n=1 Tax=Bacillus suaedaesalsae TaxID=2810349 RepID=UPI003D26821B